MIFDEPWGKEYILNQNFDVKLSNLNFDIKRFEKSLFSMECHIFDDLREKGMFQDVDVKVFLNLDVNVLKHPINHHISSGYFY